MTYKILLFFVAIIVYSSCSNDFDLTESSTEIPVVYGLLSQADSAIYIRVEKTFIDENIEPKILAQDPNNFYFDNIIVQLTNLNSNKSYFLQKVDGNAEGYPRTDGVFISAPNYLYKIHNNQLDGGKLGDTIPYELLIKKEDGSILAKSKTRVLKALQEKDITSPSSAGSLVFEYNKNFNIGFKPDSYSFIHDISLIIHYSEEKNGVVENKSLKWPIIKNYNANQPGNLIIVYPVAGRAFYEYLKSNIAPDPFVNRLLKTGSIEVTSGGVDVKNYINIVQANIGITSSGEIPTYTNIENGLGLFSSKSYVIRDNITFAPITRDSVANGIITKGLNFR